MKKPMERCDLKKNLWKRRFPSPSMDGSRPPLLSSALGRLRLGNTDGHTGRGGGGAERNRYSCYVLDHRSLVFMTLLDVGYRLSTSSRAPCSLLGPYPISICF